MKSSRLAAASISFSILSAPLVLAWTPALQERGGPRATVPTVVEGEGEGEVDPAFAAAVDVYNDHVVTLASPWMEGRLPGTRGMELAKEYMEFYFKQAGLEGPWDGSYRQPFDLAPSAELVGSSLSFGGAALAEGEDYIPLAMGASGSVEAPAVFVGYSLPRTDGDGAYQSYEKEDDLSGKIAVLFRLEPMTAEGDSRFSDQGWSGRASYAGKIREAARRGAVGVLMVNPPDANHEGMGSLLPFRGGGGTLDVPVMHVSVEAGERLLASMDPQRRSALELRELCDEGRQVFDLEGTVSMAVEMEVEPMTAENVGGLLPGKGTLKDELIVIGAHLDHLGQGEFGSRAAAEERGRVLHPGADDNASGSAAILMIADRMARDYAAMGDDASARSVLFVGFSAEESGLHGSRHYVSDPLVPIEDHALMINFDMVGRIKDKRLSLSGAKSGKGMDEFLAPIFESSELEIVQPERMSGASDHSSFYARNVPVLFGIIADFHGDYHTPRDVTSKINRVDAVNTVALFHEVGMAMATHPEGFEFQRLPDNRTARRGPRVRFGVRLADATEGAEPGVVVASVTPGSSADEGGVKAEDRLVKWNDEDLPDAAALFRVLSAHEPGDVVTFEVVRGTETLLLKAVLKASR